MIHYQQCDISVIENGLKIKSSAAALLLVLYKVCDVAFCFCIRSNQKSLWIYIKQKYPPYLGANNLARVLFTHLQGCKSVSLLNKPRYFSCDVGEKTELSPPTSLSLQFDQRAGGAGQDLGSTGVRHMVELPETWEGLMARGGGNKKKIIKQLRLLFSILHRLPPVPQLSDVLGRGHFITILHKVLKLQLDFR